MQKSKAITILKELSAWERRHLWEYVSSPYFNKNKKVLTCCKHLLSFAPDFDSSALEMEALFAHFFPGETFNHQKLRYLISDFTKLIEGFLAQQAWQQDDTNREMFVLAAYAKLKQPKYFEEKSKKIAQKLNKTATFSHQGYADRLRFLDVNFSSAARMRLGKMTGVGEVMDALDELYLVNKLRYSCELINQSKVRNRPFDFFLTTELVERMEKGEEMGGKLGKLYFLALKMLQATGDHQYYFQLKKLLSDSPEINAQERSDLYICVVNYCIQQSNQGARQFLQELFDVYKIQAEEKLILDQQGILPDQHYKNIVTVGTRMGAYEWVGNFIESYKQYLAPAIAESAYTYCLALFYSEQGKYREVKRLLAFVELPNIFYQLGSRLLLIITYYELEDFEDLSYLLNSFRMFLRRNKEITDTRRKSYQSLIRILQQVLRYREGGKVNLTELGQLLERYPDAAAHKWVTEKIAALSPL